MKREYECDIAHQLQQEWQKTTLDIDGIPTDAQKERMMKDRQKPEYRAAIEALVDHLSICPKCVHLRQPFEPVEAEPAWGKWLKTMPMNDDTTWEYTNV